MLTGILIAIALALCAMVWLQERNAESLRGLIAKQSEMLAVARVDIDTRQEEKAQAIKAKLFAERELRETVERLKELNDRYCRDEYEHNGLIADLMRLMQSRGVVHPELNWKPKAEVLDRMNSIPGR